MFTALRTRVPALVGLVLAALTLLPPGGWALCVAPGGHVDFEPLALAGSGCCTAPLDGAVTGVTSGDSDCRDCRDHKTFDGSLALGRLPGLDAMPAVAPLAPALVCPAPDLAPLPRVSEPPPPSSALRTGTQLRN